MRKVSRSRITKETNVSVAIDLDGTGQCEIDTPVGFFNHMLELFAFHSEIDLTIKATGDVDVDGHHLVEDVGLLLGACIKEALGERKGIQRYGAMLLPMDETLARAVVDLSGRPTLVYLCDYNRFDLGTLDVQNIEEFFKSLVNESKITLHLEVLYGSNDHHKAEALFKGFGRAMKDAVKIVSDVMPSSKGVL